MISCVVTTHHELASSFGKAHRKHATLDVRVVIKQLLQQCSVLTMSRRWRTNTRNTTKLPSACPPVCLKLAAQPSLDCRVALVCATQADVILKLPHNSCGARSRGMAVHAPLLQAIVCTSVTTSNPARRGARAKAEGGADVCGAVLASGTRED